MKHTITTKSVRKEDMEIVIKTESGYFSITGTIWEKGKRKTDRNIYRGGCIHEDILKVMPSLKQFVDLHLSDLTGTPMYAVENGAYHLHHSPIEVGAKYLRVSIEEAQQLKAAETTYEFVDVMNQLQLRERWKKEAQAALSTLESLINNK